MTIPEAGRRALVPHRAEAHTLRRSAARGTLRMCGLPGKVREMGVLYLVPTPIGNLEDITLRALRVLREARLIAAEDTRTTRILLNHYQIRTPLTSYHEHNRLSKLDVLFDALHSGDIALVSDAGTPGISDPGAELVAEALARGVRVVPLPGANAALCALVASGLSAECFAFLGFPPRKRAARQALLEHYAAFEGTLIFYESPNRLPDLLSDVVAVLGESRPVCAARELTKLYEEFQRGTAASVAAHYAEHPPRGECVLLIAAAPAAPPARWDEPAVREAMQARLAAGESLRDAARALAAEAGWERRQVYALGLALRDAD